MTWVPDLYRLLEREMLTSLRYKTNPVSPAEVIYLVICGFRQLVPADIEAILKEALYRSYICLLGKFHAPLSSLLQQAKPYFSCLRVQTFLVLSRSIGHC